MKTVHLLRHAKSSWEQEGLADHDRPLAPRGRRDATAMAEHLKLAGVRPEVVLCSSSARTVETLERIAAALPAAANLQIAQELYQASGRELLERLRRLPDDVSAVMVIGHNPGIHDLALALPRSAVARQILAARFPTGTLATLTAPAREWAELTEGMADLTDFTPPRALPDAPAI